MSFMDKEREYNSPILNLLYLYFIVGLIYINILFLNFISIALTHLFFLTIVFFE